MGESKKRGGKPPLCILGTASSLPQAPWEDETIEFWGVSPVLAREDTKRLDRAFEMHPRRYWGEPQVLQRLTDFDGPVYMQAHNDEVPNSVAYPYDEVREMFYLPVMGENLFVTNTITWMLLLAIYEGYRDIMLFGIHMAHETEYGYQQASCSWALGILHGMKLKGDPVHLQIANDSELLTARYEYGYGEPTQSMRWVQNRINGMKKGVSEAQSRIKELNERKLRTEGAITEAQNIYEHLAGFK